MDLQEKCREVCIKARSPPASLPFKGQFTDETTIKWSVDTEGEGVVGQYLPFTSYRKASYAVQVKLH